MSGHLKPLNGKAIVSVRTKEKTKRPLAEVDGIKYEMAIPGDFTQFKQARALRLQVIVQSINEKPESEWTDDDLQQVEEAYVLLMMMMIPKLPRSVIEELGDDERNALIQAFYSNAEKVNAELEAKQGTEEVIEEAVRAP